MVYIVYITISDLLTYESDNLFTQVPVYNYNYISYQVGDIQYADTYPNCYLPKPTLFPHIYMQKTFFVE